MARKQIRAVDLTVQVTRTALPAAQLATFRAGEPIPFAPYLRMIVPGDMEPAVATSIEAEARKRAAVKVIREPKPSAVVTTSAPVTKGHARSLRQVVLERAARIAGGTGAKAEALTELLNEALTQAGI